MEDRCVVCGAIIPEGRQICYGCEQGRSCGNCKHLNRDSWHELICTNEKSDERYNWMDEESICKRWEGK